MGKKSELTVPQRREAVLALLKKEETAAEISKRLGVSENSLYRWRNDFLSAGEAALAEGSTKRGKNLDRQRVDELEADLRERDLVIGELTVANRVLKKLTGESP